MRMKSFSYQLLLPTGLFAIKLIDSLIEEVFVGLMDEIFAEKNSTFRYIRAWASKEMI